jgi:DNA-binding GntR family transcriptional regulator
MTETPPYLSPFDSRGTALGDEVFTRIGQAIVDGHLAPGERVRDQELAERFGVSRTPVREALQRLERIGLIEVSPNRYTRVSIPNDRVANDTFEFVAYLMGTAARMMAARCTDEELAAVVADTDTVIDASRANDVEAMNAASVIFFAKVTRASGNVAAIQLMREAEIAIRRHVGSMRPVIACPIGRTQVYEQFRDALLTRDGDLAERLIRELHGLP